MKVLVHTWPYDDGLGDQYSAYRMYLLLKEENPSWDIRLHIPPIPEDFKQIFPKAYTLVADNLSTPIEESWIPDCVVNVAGQDAYDNIKKISDMELSMAPHHVIGSLQEEGYGSIPCIAVKEYMNSTPTTGQMMQLAHSELNEMSQVTIGENISDLAIQQQLTAGDYYFAYGRDNTTECFIQALLDSHNPILVVAPGYRNIKIDSQYKVQIIDYNTGEKSGSDSPDVILVRGQLENKIFKRLLQNTNQEPVLVTGDMSTTEALYLEKLPFYDFQPLHLVESYDTRLYIRAEETPRQNKVDFFIEQLAFFAENPSEFAETKQQALQEYQRRNTSSKLVTEQLRNMEKQIQQEKDAPLPPPNSSNKPTANAIIHYQVLSDTKPPSIKIKITSLNSNYRNEVIKALSQPIVEENGGFTFKPEITASKTVTQGIFTATNTDNPQETIELLKNKLQTLHTVPIKDNPNFTVIAKESSDLTARSIKKPH